MTLPAILPGTPPVILTGENSAEALRQANKAAASANSAAASAAQAGKAAQLVDPFSEVATALPAELAAIKDLYIFNAKAHDYRLSLYKATTAELRVDIWDEQIGDRVAYGLLSSPNYAALPDRIPIVSSNPLTSVWSGIQGYIELNTAAVTESAAVYQYTTAAESRINPRKVKTRFEYRNRHPADNYAEVIEVGAGRTYTTIRAALEALYDNGPLADQTNPAQLPSCIRATPDHKIGLVFDAATFQGVSEHIPDYVYLIARYRHQTIFEHSAGATTPIIEGQANTGAHGCVFRSTVANEYAWHMDYAHTVMSPDTEGDYLREYWNVFEDCQFIVGPSGTLQAYGSGIGTQAGARFIGCEFDCENAGYAGILAGANNASNTGDNIGGGAIEFENCTDISGRVSTAPTVGVQVKFASTYPNVLRINDCKNFDTVSLAPGGSSATGQWRLAGNWTGTVDSTIAGDDMGYVA